MKLNQVAINEFKEIYFTEFGKIISNDEAKQKGSELLHLFNLIYKPIAVSDYKNVVKGSTIKSVRTTLNKDDKVNGNRPTDRYTKSD